MKHFIVLIIFLFSSTYLISQSETLVVVTEEEIIDVEKPIMNHETDQERSKFSIGAHLGLSQSGTDTHSWGRHGEGIFDHSHLTYGLNAKYNFSQTLGIRADYFGTSISGDDRENDGPCSDANDQDTDSACHRERAWRFNSPLHELSMSLEWDILGKKRYPKTTYYNVDGEKLDPNSVRLGYGTYYHENGDVIHFSEVNKFKRKLSPYIAVGLAMTYVDPEPMFVSNDQAPSSEDILADINEQKNIYLHLPVTVGLRYDLSEKFFIDAEARGVFESTDLLDGMKHVANFEDERNHEDVYQFATIRFGYRLGISKDTDGDGVPDKRDVCPDIWGIAMLNGCPDRDGDGISDELDACPDTRGIRKFAGCPDTDGDGVQDLLDGCPELLGTIETKGCPDQDLDGVIDDLDLCPTKYGSALLDGCPDRDNDGIPDHRDACPDVKGEDAYHGCNEGYPSLSEENRKRYELEESNIENSTDNVIIESSNRVQESANVIKTRVVEEVPRNVESTTTTTTTRTTNQVERSNPTTTTTSEVITSSQPTTTTTTKVIKESQPTSTSTSTTRVVSNNTPVTTTTKKTTSTTKVGSVDIANRNMEAEKLFSKAITGIKFNSAKATFLSDSYPMMDEVAMLMKTYPDLKIRISGHTDSNGDDQRNKILSAQRANAVKNYFVRKGIKRNRLIAKGFGETKPIGDNATAEGRIQNRRIELSIVE